MSSDETRRESEFLFKRVSYFTEDGNLGPHLVLP